MTLPLDHLELLEAPAAGANGMPMLLPLDDIDEDPAQPRREFDDQSLAELAETIGARGVRQPVSVRRHPSQPGRWMLNFGARRLRASKLAGKVEIPVFVDEAADDYDQVIENEQREGLKPLDLALFVQRRLAAGDSHRDIARRLGKSKTYITMVCAMIDPPDWLLDVYRSGRCRGVSELYELRRLHGSRPEAVDEFLTRRQKVSRAAVRAMKTDSARAEPTTSSARPRSEAIPVDDAEQSEPAALQRRAERLCTELGTTLDRLKTCSPDRLRALSGHVGALQSRCTTSAV